MKKELFEFFLVLSQMYFHPHVHAYAVQRTNEYKVINLSNAADLKPLHVISYKENLLVNTRFKNVFMKFKRHVNIDLVKM